MIVGGVFLSMSDCLLPHEDDNADSRNCQIFEHVLEVEFPCELTSAQKRIVSGSYQ